MALVNIALIFPGLLDGHNRTIRVSTVDSGRIVARCGLAFLDTGQENHECCINIEASGIRYEERKQWAVPEFVQFPSETIRVKIDNFPVPNPTDRG
jgi:hypothetical protein